MEALAVIRPGFFNMHGLFVEGGVVSKVGGITSAVTVFDGMKARIYTLLRGGCLKATIYRLFSVLEAVDECSPDEAAKEAERIETLARSGLDDVAVVTVRGDSVTVNEASTSREPLVYIHEDDIPSILLTGVAPRFMIEAGGSKLYIDASGGELVFEAGGFRIAAGFEGIHSIGASLPDRLRKIGTLPGGLIPVNFA